MPFFAGRKLPMYLAVNGILFLFVAAMMTNGAFWNAGLLKSAALLLLANAIIVLIVGAVLAGLRAETDALRQRAHIGRLTVITGAIFLMVAFGSATAVITRVLPSDSILADRSGPLLDSKITPE